MFHPLASNPDGKRHYGKAINLGSLKQRVLSDVSAGVETIQNEAAQFRAKATVKQDTCPLCHSTNARPYIEVHGYPYYRCPECELVFLYERLSATDLIDYWAQSFSASIYNDMERWELRREQVERPKYAFFKQVWQGQPGKWLDLGCGAGQLMSLAKAEGWDVLGLELAPDLVELVEGLGMPVHLADLFGYLKRDDACREWDVISAIGYLDAIDDVHTDVKTVSELLKPGGLYFTLSPHYPSLSMTLAEKRPDSVFRYICPPGSTNFFSRRSYQYMEETFNLRVVHEWYMGMEVYDLLNHLAHAGRAVPGDEHYRAVWDAMPAMQLALDKLEMSDYAHVIFRKEK